MPAPTITENAPGPLTRDWSGIRTTRSWRVVAASAVQAENIISNSLGIRMGVSYESIYGETPDANVVCMGINTDAIQAAPIGGTGLYEVVAEWGIDMGSEARPGGPPKYIMKGSVIRSNADIDRYGQPIMNSSDEPFGQPTFRYDSEEILTVKWVVSLADTSLNVSGFTSVTDYASVLAIIRPYRGALNSATWQGAAVESVMCLDITATPVGQPDFATLVYCEGQFHYKPPIDPSTDLPNTTIYTYNGSTWSTTSSSFSAWYDIRADRGYRTKGAVVSSIQTYNAITDADGNEIREPVSLDGLGARLQTATDPVVRIFKPRVPLKNFNTLGI